MNLKKSIPIILPLIQFDKSVGLNYHFQIKIVWADGRLCSNHRGSHFAVDPFLKISFVSIE